MKSSSREFLVLFLGHSKYHLKLKLKREFGKRLVCLLAGELDETINPSHPCARKGISSVVLKKN